MGPQSSPLVSVCIPIYNCEDYISQAIESVLGQTFTDLELIIIDNDSSDKSLELIKTYSDPRIRVIENDRNIGLEANWNLALAEARGEYIKLLPADDFLLPQCLERQVNAFRQQGCESVVLTSCARNIVDATGKRILTRQFPGKDRLIEGHLAIKKVVRSGTNLLGEPGAILFRRDRIESAGVFDGSLLYVIDVDLWLRLLLDGYLYVVREPLCSFRLSLGSQSIDIAAIQSHHFSSFIKNLLSDRRYKLSRFDTYQGIIMSKVLAWGRKLVYAMTVRDVAGESE